MAQRRGILLAALAVAVCSAGSAQGTVLTGANLNTTVTAAVKPSSLPKRGNAPVTLSLSGATNQRKEAKSVTVQLDPQLAINGEGHPTCKPSDVNGVPLALARRKCSTALIGSGSMTQRYLFPGVSPDSPTIVDVHGSLLFFNGSASRLLTYLFMRDPVANVPTTITALGIAKRGVLEIPGPGRTMTAFKFRFGRTWNERGRKVGYLSGRCATGTLRNRITLTLTGGGTASSVLTQPCKGI